MSLRDLRFALRTLVRSPVFSVTAIVTIAVGIGAITAIFSVANAVLLRPLPYGNPDRLVLLYSDLRARNNLGMPFSNENFVDLRDGAKGSIAEMAGVQTVRQVLPNGEGNPEQIRLGIVTANFFQVLGVAMPIGRDFEAADGVPPPPPPAPVTQGPPAPGAAPAQAAPPPPPLPTMAILSHEDWQRRFGGDRAILGQPIPTGGPQRLIVVGVLPPVFEILLPPADNVEPRPDVFIANRLTYNNAQRNSYGLHPIGRLAAGATHARAQDDLEKVAAEIRKNFTVYGTANYYVRLEPMHGALVTEVRPAILALMGAGAFLLLIACANVANLVLVRASLRETELAVRAALGGGSWQLVRPMLAESILIAGAGTIGGLLLAYAGVRALLAVAPARLPRLEGVRIDPYVLAFAAAAGIAAALIFGLAPAVRALRLNVMKILRGSSRTEGLGRGSLLRQGVVAVEVALCFVLLVGSGLMVRSFLALQRIDPGFDPNNMLTFQLLGGRGGPPDQRAATMRQLQTALAALPGVEAATASFPFPLAGDFSTIRWGTAEALADNSKFQAVDWQRVHPGYFETMRTTIVEGRTFTEADNQSRQNVVVVDEMLAAKAFPKQSAVGQRILIRIRTPEPEWVDIIGVVKHQRVTTLADPGREQVYFTDGFLGFGGARKWALRTSGDPAAVSGAVRAAIAGIDPQFLMTDVQPMSVLVEKSQSSTRFQLLLVGVFASVAALLVAVGLYGVLSTIVRQRTAEIGVRMALGAAPSGILALVVTQGMRLSAVGLLAGVAAAFGLTRLIRSLLIGVEATDPLTYAVMAGVFVIIVAGSAWLPARRAAALDPTVALRGE